jgi:exopolyphosphatase
LTLLDLDSLCSAVVLAYLRTYTSHIGSLYIPLSNLPSADLALRPELIPVLSNANLKPSDLITLSDLPPMNTIASQLPPEKTRWILVDHNAMDGELSKIYGKRLVGCIDHHAEENAVPKDCREEPRIVRKSGSCMTLVVESCKDAVRNIGSLDFIPLAVDRRLAILAHFFMTLHNLLRLQSTMVREIADLGAPVGGI